MFASRFYLSPFVKGVKGVFTNPLSSASLVEELLTPRFSLTETVLRI